MYLSHKHESLSLSSIPTRNGALQCFCNHSPEGAEKEDGCTYSLRLVHCLFGMTDNEVLKVYAEGLSTERLWHIKSSI